MVEAIAVGSPPIDVRVRKNKRARRLILRLGRDGPVVTVPPGVSIGAVRDFLSNNETWLRKRLDDAPVPSLVRHGAQLPIEGRMVRLKPGAGRVRLESDALVVPGDGAKVPARVAAFLKAHARRRLTSASERHARTLGRSYTKITLRDTKSRWGSCSSTGNLMYSWRLFMAPPEVLDYVAAHEVAHLVEFNHSRYFWRLVDDLCPDYPYHRAWLKENGPQLHGYRFTA